MCYTSYLSLLYSLLTWGGGMTYSNKWIWRDSIRHTQISSTCFVLGNSCLKGVKFYSTNGYTCFCPALCVTGRESPPNSLPVTHNAGPLYSSGSHTKFHPLDKFFYYKFDFSVSSIVFQFDSEWYLIMFSRPLYFCWQI